MTIKIAVWVLSHEPDESYGDMGYPIGAFASEADANAARDRAYEAVGGDQGDGWTDGGEGWNVSGPFEVEVPTAQLGPFEKVVGAVQKASVVALLALGLAGGAQAGELDRPLNLRGAAALHGLGNLADGLTTEWAKAQSPLVVETNNQVGSLTGTKLLVAAGGTALDLSIQALEANARKGGARGRERFAKIMKWGIRGASAYYYVRVSRRNMAVGREAARIEASR